LRDQLFSDQHTPPVAAYGSKYLGVDPMTGLNFVRPGRPLRPENVAKFGRQIIEGLRYLESRSVPYFHLHTGNVVLVNGVAQLSDYKNAFVGMKHRLHKKLKRLPHVDPQFGSLACLLYEISTGIEPQPLKKFAAQAAASPSADAMASPSASSPSSNSGGSGHSLDLIVRDPKYAEVNDLIQLIVNASHSITCQLNGNATAAKQAPSVYSDRSSLLRCAVCVVR
jgi:hypothetical protein